MGIGSPIGRWITRSHALKKQYLPLPKQPSIFNNPSTRGGAIPVFRMGFWLASSWAVVIQVTIAAVNQCIQQLHSFQKSSIHSFPSCPPELLFSLQTPLPRHFLSWKGGQWMQMSCRQVSTQNYLYTALWKVLCLCVNHNPLHKEASLTYIVETQINR